MKKLLLNLLLLVCVPAAACFAQCDVQIVETSAISCNAQCDGQIVALVGTGTGPFAYSWEPSISGDSVATDLCAGQYIVTITDDVGCTATASFDLEEPAALEINATSTPISCYGMCDGTIDITVTGGTEPYQYLWSADGSSTDAEDLSDVCPGSLCVFVTDNNNCPADKCDFFFTEPDELTVEVTSLSGVDYMICHGDADQSVLAFPSGGTEPYTYEWSNGASDQLVNELGAGTYILTLTDTNGCVAIDSITFTEPDPFVISYSLSDYNGYNISCNGLSDGTICAMVSGQVEPYTYIWTSGSADSCATDLFVGQTCLTILDVNGCYVDTCFELTEPEAIVTYITYADPTCEGCSDGFIADSVVGGVAPYTYAWDPDVTSDSASYELPAGPYTICVTDANSCSATCDDVVLSDPLGVRKLAGQNFVVSPNPSTGRFSIAFKDAPSNAVITITDAIGKVVFNDVYNKTSGLVKEITLNEPAGIYFVRISYADVNVSTKIVKQ